MDQSEKVVVFSEDLVALALEYREFLKKTDDVIASNLAPHVLATSVKRYETCWLPLKKKYPNSPLLPPLDVQWIWHLHMFNPNCYISDCQEIVGHIPDHGLHYNHCSHTKCKHSENSQNHCQQPEFTNTKSSQSQCKHADCQSSHCPNSGCQNRDCPRKDSVGSNCPLLLESRTAWIEAFPDEPYCLQANCVSPNPSYFSKCSVDLQACAIREANYYYNVSLPHFGDAHFLSNALERYMVFLKRKDLLAHHALPVFDIDLIWRAHMLRPLLYAKETMSLLGEVLPYTSPLSTGPSYETSFLQELCVPGSRFRGFHPRKYLGHLGPAEIGHKRNGQDFYRHQEHGQPQVKDEQSLNGQSNYAQSTNVHSDDDMQQNIQHSGSGHDHKNKQPKDWHPEDGKRKDSLRLKVKPGKFRKEVVQGEDLSSILGPVSVCYVPTEVHVDAADHVICDQFGEELFSLGLRHSVDVHQSVIQILHKGKLVALSHIVGHEQIVTKDQVGPDSDSVILDSLNGERSILVKSHDGDQCIIKGIWKRYIPGADVYNPKDKGNLDISVHYLSQGSNDVHFWNIEPFAIDEAGHFSFDGIRMEMDSGEIYVDDLSSGSKSVVLSLTVAFSILIIYILCEPRFDDGPMALEEDKQQYRRKAHLQACKMLKLLGLGQEVPTNNWTYWLLHTACPEVHCPWEPDQRHQRSILQPTDRPTKEQLDRNIDRQIEGLRFMVFSLVLLLLLTMATVCFVHYDYPLSLFVSGE